jgi:hypothetical protein
LGHRYQSITAAIALATLVAGFFQYKKESDTKIAITNLQKEDLGFEIVKNKISMLAEITQVTSQLSTIRSEYIFNESLERFWKLYYRELLFVDESSDIIKFMNTIKDVVVDRNGLEDLDESNKHLLKRTALNLARACKLQVDEMKMRAQQDAAAKP